MQKKLLIGTILSFGLLVTQIGCSDIAGKPQTSTQSVNTGADKTEVSESEPVDTSKEKDDKEKALMAEYDALIQKDAKASEVIIFINTNIGLVSEENASKMVNGLEMVQKKNIAQLENKFYDGNSIQQKMSEVYKTDFTLDKLDDINDSELKELLAETRDNGYKVETAEGTFFPIINYEVYKKYSSNVTKDMKEYIEIAAEESNSVSMKDAAIVIGWDEVMKRVLKQEAFIRDNKNSDKVNDVKKLFERYTFLAFFGSNNTPAFAYDTKTLVPEVKTAYLALGEAADSKFVKEIKGFMEVLEKSSFKLTDEVENYRKKAVETLKQ